MYQMSVATKVKGMSKDKTGSEMKGFRIEQRISANDKGELPEGAQRMLESLKASTTKPDANNPDLLTVEFHYPAGATAATFSVEGEDISGEVVSFKTPAVPVRFLTDGKSIFYESNEGIFFGFTPGSGKSAQQLLAEIKARNLAAGWQTEDGFESGTEATPKAKPTHKENVIKFSSTKVNSKIVVSLSNTHNWKASRNQKTEIYSYETKDQKGKKEYTALKTIYSIDNEVDRDIWESLYNRGAMIVKMHYAMWGLYYEATRGESLKSVHIRVNDLCRYLGIKEHHKGGFKKEQKNLAKRIFTTLCKISIQVYYQSPGSGKIQRIRGSLWDRGLERDEFNPDDADTYDDLFGAAGIGHPDDWEPKTLSFKPGAWYEDDTWRKTNAKRVGKLARGFMQLDTRYDDWAILIGGYLASVSRMNGYKPIRRSLRVLLQNTGRFESYAHRRSQAQDKIGRALTRLKEVGVITDWTTDGDNAEDIDVYDVDALAEYSATIDQRQGNWLDEMYTVNLPFLEDENRIQEAKSTQLQKASRRKTRAKTGITKARKR